MAFALIFASLGLLLVLYTLYRRSTKVSVAKVPGPPCTSFLYGNIPELSQCQAGEVEFQWQAVYGNVMRLKDPLGGDVLLISDPKALQHIFHTSGYRYPKHNERRALGRMLTGPGLTWAHGDVHKRQRKVMLPGFGAPEAKALVPVFSSMAAKLVNKWLDILSDSPDQSIVVDIPSWTSRATLDVIGEAAFDYHFGALDNADNELSKAYHNVFVNAFGNPSNMNILFWNVAKYIPDRILKFVLDTAPSARLIRVRHTEKVVIDVARALVHDKSSTLLQAQGTKDIMSLIVKANASEDPKSRLTEEEMIAQMQTIIIAGHETTSTSLSWVLLELCKNPEIQTKLRKEIHHMRNVVQCRGEAGFTARDFDSMPYLTAVIKESFRLNPAVYNLVRQAGIDDILPLSTPITTISGDIIYELPVPKGMKIICSLAGYNRIPEIFGKDPHIYNPDRWLDGSVSSKSSSVGVYANLMTFSGGLRACIGWRFAVLEVQSFLVELISNFEVSLTPEAKRVRREAAGMMTPTVDGQAEKGTQLPLVIRVAKKDESDA